MRQRYFVVTFKNGKTVFASCFNHTEAKILSQAVMIKNALSYDVKGIRLAIGIEERQETDFVS